jgi:hypothetical protein
MDGKEVVKLNNNVRILFTQAKFSRKYPGIQNLWTMFTNGRLPAGTSSFVAFTCCLFPNKFEPRKI